MISCGAICALAAIGVGLVYRHTQRTPRLWGQTYAPADIGALAGLDEVELEDARAL